MIKQAADQLARQLREKLAASVAEQCENLKLARHNARCPVEQIQPYKIEAQLAAVRAVEQLLDMVKSAATD